MQIRRAIAGAALVIATAAQAAPPSGVTLGPASSSYSVNLFGAPSPAFGSGPGNGTTFGPDNAASWSISYGASPAISLTIVGAGTGNLFLRYTYAITAANQAAFDDFSNYLLLDPNNGAELNGFYSVELNGPGQGIDAFAYTTINTGFGEVRFQCRADGGPGPDCTGSTGGTYNQQGYIVTGALVPDLATLSFYGTVAMAASIFKLGDAPAIAFIDPAISLPSAYLNGGGNAANFQVNYSPNLVGGVPEPASWAMLIAGFGLIGAVARRRRLPRTA
jgi:hypothetical protein